MPFHLQMRRHIAREPPILVTHFGNFRVQVILAVHLLVNFLASHCAVRQHLTRSLLHLDIKFWLVMIVVTLDLLFRLTWRPMPLMLRINFVRLLDFEMRDFSFVKLFDVLVFAL